MTPRYTKLGEAESMVEAAEQVTDPEEREHFRRAALRAVEATLLDVADLVRRVRETR